MRLTEEKLVSVLCREGYKVTRQRRAVLSVISESQEHLNPIEIHEKVHRDYPNVGLVTVYRTLDTLSKLGLICRVHVGGTSCRYVVAPQEHHHHHIICSDCGTVVNFTECDLTTMEQSIEARTGFSIQNHLLEFFGRCQACQNSAEVSQV